VQKRLIAATFLLASCGPAAAPNTVPPPGSGSSSAQAQTPPAVPKGKPEIGDWGFDLAGMNRQVAPGANFYNYANGTWQAKTPIPADKSNYGMFTALSDQSDARTKEIILNASGEPGTESRKVADYYKAFMDEEGIEKRGLTPIQPELDAIVGIRDVAGLVSAFARNSRLMRSSPLTTIVTQDDREPEKHIANVAQGGLGLPDRDMYDAKAKQFEKVREGYKKYLEAVFTLAGQKDGKRRAAAVYALEEKLALQHWTKVENRDPVKTYNKLTVEELEKLAPGIDWKQWLTAVGLAGQTHVNVNQPSAVGGTAKLIKSEPVAVWKDYLTVRLISSTAPFLPKRFVDAHFEMYGRTLSGTPELKERWKRGVEEVTGSMGEAVGKIYVSKHFTPDTKARADELVKNLLVAMGQRLESLAWMSPETKAKAKAKLATYNPKIGYPKNWRDYSALTVVADNPVENDARASAFEYDRRLAKLGKPVDRDEWEMVPMTVNAYYNPVLNEIVFPAAILQPPFFDPNADDAINYGGIGAVIGHEISHGFDDQGSQYDASGALKNWWTADDAAKFKAATNQLVAQYAAYCPFPAQGEKPAQCVKGDLTLGENIADLAGLTVAHSAYRLSLAGKEAPVYDGMTGDQRFFLGWAQVWRRLYRDQELANRLITDPHSPSEFRTAVVRNLDSFYEAFKPEPKDAHFLAPNQRVRIW
jgi:putative endopeptidase